MSFSFEVKANVTLKNVKYDGKGDIDCSENDLTTLKGCPEEVNGDFDCSYNKLTNLKGCPKVVNGDFECYNNQLTSLKECPKVVNGEFDCSSNQLTTLKGCPEEVNGDFCCASNYLTTLKDGPKVVKGDFICNDNSKLEDISDLPNTVTNIYITCCHDIKVFPKHIKDTLVFYNMPKRVLERLKKQKHLEIVEKDNVFNTVTIREKSLGQQLLTAI